jgi:RNA polymerase sporulation-specific sigma factor
VHGRTRPLRLAGADDDELAARAQAGHARAEHLLLQRHRRLAASMRRSYFLVGADREDVEQEAMIGLVKAIRDYRPGAASFRVFAEVCVTRQVASAIKAATRHKHRALDGYLSLTPDGGSDPGGAPALAQALRRCSAPDPVDHVVVAERTAALAVAVRAVLSAFEAEVLGRHLEGWTYAEVAEHLGRDLKAVDNALQRARRKVAAHLDAERAVRRRDLAS